MLHRLAVVATGLFDCWHIPFELTPVGQTIDTLHLTAHRLASLNEIVQRTQNTAYSFNRDLRFATRPRILPRDRADDDNARFAIGQASDGDRYILLFVEAGAMQESNMSVCGS